jgi:hypothetical protein
MVAAGLTVTVCVVVAVHPVEAFVHVTVYVDVVAGLTVAGFAKAPGSQTLVVICPAIPLKIKFGRVVKVVIVEAALTPQAAALSLNLPYTEIHVVAV